jgi:hypothetical protein
VYQDLRDRAIEEDHELPCYEIGSADTFGLKSLSEPLLKALLVARRGSKRWVSGRAGEFGCRSCKAATLPAGIFRPKSKPPKHS